MEFFIILIVLLFVLFYLFRPTSNLVFRYGAITSNPGPELVGPTASMPPVALTTFRRSNTPFRPPPSKRPTSLPHTSLFLLYFTGCQQKQDERLLPDALCGLGLHPRAYGVPVSFYWQSFRSRCWQSFWPCCWLCWWQRCWQCCWRYGRQ